MTTNQNPLLQKIKIPGKRFRLPSRGLFYTQGELEDGVVDGEIIVYPMTSIDEMYLRSPELLFNGEAIDIVIKRCCPEIKKPLQLVSKDVDFILACLRVVSYGNSYTIKTKCPKCEELTQIKNEINLNKFLEEIETKAKEQNIPYEEALESDVVQSKIKAIKTRTSADIPFSIQLGGIIQNNTTEISNEEYIKYNFSLSNGQYIKTTPIKMDSSVIIYQFQNNKMDLDLTAVDDFVALMLSSTVLEIDGISDEKLIIEWAKQLPLPLKREYEEKLRELSVWGTDFNYLVECPEENCKHKMNVNTHLNPITFFMTPSK